MKKLEVAKWIGSVVGIIYLCLSAYAVADGGIFQGKYEVRVDKESQYDKENEKEFCSDFNIDDRKAKLYFQHAKIISSWEYTHKNIWTNCYALGRIMLDGKELTWEIRRGGLGKLTLPSGDIALLVCTKKACKNW